MQTHNLVNLVILLACGLGLLNLWRRLRSGELSIWDIKEYLQQLGLLFAAVLILMIVIALISPVKISVGNFIRGYIITLIFFWIIWSIGRARRDY